MSQYSEGKFDQDNDKRKSNKSKKRKNGKRGNKYDRRTSNKSGVDGGNLPSTNDFAWYNKFPDLLDAYARSAFPYRPGSRIIYGDLVAADTVLSCTPKSIPGVMTIFWLPSIGSGDSLQAINTTADQIYARVRSKFSGNIDVDGQDIMLYLMSLSSVFSYLASLKRVFRILNAYNPNNFNVPDGLLRALGLSSTAAFNLRQSKMEFFGIINELIHMTSTLRCPAVFPLFNRQYWMCDNVYSDANSSQAQLYVFSPEAFYCFSPTVPIHNGGSAVGGGLIYANNPFTQSNFDGSVTTLYNYGRRLIGALLNNADSFTISGYLERAYDGFPTFSVDPLMYNEVFTPIYDETVLSQIENSRSMNTITGLTISSILSQWQVRQDEQTNSLINHQPVPQYKTTDTATSTLKLVPNIYPTINLHGMEQSVQNVVEASRLLTYDTIQNFSAADSISTIPTGGSEIVTRYQIIVSTFVDSGSQGEMSYSIYPMSSIYQITNDGITNNQLINVIKLLPHFDWHPAVWLVNNTTIDPLIDMADFTRINPTDFAHINKAVLYSEFDTFAQY